MTPLLRLTLVLHIIAGSVGLLTGFIALYARKGGVVHRRSGTVFVYAMLAMCAGGFIIASSRHVAPTVNIPAALLTGYLVITGVTTLRPAAQVPQWLAPGAMILVLAVAVTNLAFAIMALAAGGKLHGVPAFPFFLFAVVGLLAGAGDLRVIRFGALRGPARLARHLWRMCFALVIAALSFFIGQAKVIPKPIRIMPLLALPMLIVLLTMFYWMWRMRRRGSRGQPARALMHSMPVIE